MPSIVFAAKLDWPSLCFLKYAVNSSLRLSRVLLFLILSEKIKNMLFSCNSGCDLGLFLIRYWPKKRQGLNLLLILGSIFTSKNEWVYFEFKGFENTGILISLNFFGKFLKGRE